MEEAEAAEAANLAEHAEFIGEEEPAGSEAEPSEAGEEEPEPSESLPQAEPPPPPSGQGILLLRLAAPEGSRTSIFPRSAPTRRKKSKFLWCSCSSSILLFLSCI